MLVTYYKNLANGVVWTSDITIPQNYKRALFKNYCYSRATESPGVVYAIRSNVFNSGNNILFAFSGTNNNNSALEIGFDINITGMIEFEAVLVGDTIDVIPSASIANMGIISFGIEYFI